jgi:uncharacterized protein (DUF1810 family)
MTADPFDLRRFRAAQEQGGTYVTALAELRAGRKRSHWIWFVFPQLDGLGSSPMARRYAIRSLDEARAYLADGVLGSRLHACCEALLALDASPGANAGAGAGTGAGTDAEAVLGAIDALKLRSSMTLFGLAAPAEPVFTQVLERYYGGQADATTERLLAATDA